MNTRNNSLSEDKVKYFINLDESSQWWNRQIN
jgi:hypothetical protein